MDRDRYVLVLMSSHNGQKYIEEQIMSIMLQDTIHSIDLRIRDDGSNDGTLEIVQELQKKFPDRIELIHGERIGINASFFSLLNSAQGYMYYALSDQDDVWLPNKIQKACDSLGQENTNTPLLYATTSYLVGDDLIPHGTTRKMYKNLSLYNTIIQNICPGHTQVLNNKMLELVKDDIDVSRIYVYDSWITNMAVLYGKVLFSNTPYVLYRQHASNQLGTATGQFGKLIKSAIRIRRGDGHKYRNQIEYFVQKNQERMVNDGLFEEIHALLSANTFLKRIRYLINCKIYRQSILETVAMYFAIMIGKF